MSSTHDEKVRIPIRTYEPQPEILQSKSTYDGGFGIIDPTMRDGLYNFITSISKENLLFYMVIILIIAIIFSRIDIRMNIIIGLIIGAGVVYYLIDKSKTLNDSEFATIEMKLASIKPLPKFFYVDANLIELMYNLLEYSSYSPEDYTNAIEHIDNVLKLQLDIENGMEDCDAIMDIIRDEAEKAVESMAGILVAIPGESIILKDKLVNGIKKLQIFLQRHIDICDGICGAIKLA